MAKQAHALVNNVWESISGEPPKSHNVYTYLYPGNLAVATGTTRWYNPKPFNGNIISARASVGTAPTGAPIIISIYHSGGLLKTLTIPINTFTSGRKVIDRVFTPESYLTISVTQVGSTVSGANGTVQIEYAV